MSVQIEDEGASHNNIIITVLEHQEITSQQTAPDNFQFFTVTILFSGGTLSSIDYCLSLPLTQEYEKKRIIGIGNVHE